MNKEENLYFLRAGLQVGALMIVCWTALTFFMPTLDYFGDKYENWLEGKSCSVVTQN